MHRVNDAGLDQNLMCPLKEAVSSLGGQETTRDEDAYIASWVPLQWLHLIRDRVKLLKFRCFFPNTGLGQYQ